MKYPKVYLAIDNCFAFKRWTRPGDWAKVIKDLGVNYVEASADTELDPLFMGEEYIKDWVEQVKEAEQKEGVKVANLYSGHGTYCTLGLAHTDERVRRRMIDKWFKQLIKTAAELEAGIGFFAHAFADFVLQDKEIYDQYLENLYSGLIELNNYAYEVGCGNLGVEQMYSPHQVPWTIDGAKELIKQVTRRSKRDFYFTEDVGHHHVKYLKPTREKLLDVIEEYRKTGKIKDIWLGVNSSYDILKNSDDSDRTVSEIMQQVDENPHMFAQIHDGDCYEWIRKLGCYSPIIHLQQTNGLSSSHAHFTKKNNEQGKITGEKILKALKESYENKQEQGMPQKCDKIYLTIEAFTSTASINNDTLSDYAQSVNYWRKYIPTDGMYLDELVDSSHNSLGAIG